MFPLKCYRYLSMVTAANDRDHHDVIETFSALLAMCAGNSPAIGDFPAQRPVKRSFDVFFDLRLNKRLRKSWGCCFERPLRPLWRQCNVLQRSYYSCWWPDNTKSQVLTLARKIPASTQEGLKENTQAPDSIWRCHLTSIGNPIVEIRRS